MYREPSSNSEPLAAVKRDGRAYNTVWRWHFYAGLFCIPFIIWLSITGALYLFKPQFEAAMEYPMNHLSVDGAAEPPSRQIAAALAAVPGSVLNAYILPSSPNAAVRVLVGHDARLMRVYVHPQTLRILKVEDEDGRVMRILFHLHGELLMGDRGSMIVELAASWAIALFITGIYLWWPRNARGLGGIAFPRLQRGEFLRWRDLHAVVGFWVTAFTLFLLVSGLPWAKSWGGMLKEARHWGGRSLAQQDWTTGRTSELNERRAMNRPRLASPSAYGAIDRMVPLVVPLHLASPVLLTPPSLRSPDWMARSEAQNRTLRVNLVLDAVTGRIISRQNFSDRLLLDRLIGVGVAAHEGQLFGWLNQFLGVLKAAGLVLMSVSATVLWLRRKTPDSIGAPDPSGYRPARGVIALIVVLSLILPMLGLSVLLMLVLEYSVLRRSQAISRYLRLDGQ